MTGSLSLALLNPLISVALAITVFWVARAFPKFAHLNYLSVSLLCVGLAFVSNDLLGPIESPAHRILVNIAFFGGILSAAFAAIRRVGLPIPWLQVATLTSVTTLAFLWFLFVTPSTDFRIYIVNFANSLIAIRLIWLLIKAKPTSHADWIIIGFAALLLCISIARPVFHAFGGFGEDHTGYWMSVMAFTPIITVYCTLVFFWALGKQLYEDLKEEAGKDYLTSLLNRRGFEQRTALLQAQREVTDEADLLIVADIDDFKSINDTFGHTKGDQILRLVAETLSQHAPRGAVARTGGEEFSIYIPHGTMDEANQLARNVAESLDRAKSRLLSDGRPLTLSFGASQAANKTLQEMTLSADSALYASKAAGKNRLSFA